MRETQWYRRRGKIYSPGYRKKQSTPKCAGDRARMWVTTSVTEVGSEGGKEESGEKGQAGMQWSHCSPGH